MALKRAIVIGKWLVALALTAASLYVLYVAVFWFLLSRVLYFRNIEDTSAKNTRGDTVFAESDLGGGPTHPSDTEIWLKRAGHLFSTTLLEAQSYELSVGLRWRDDDDLIVQLDLGCDGTHTTPVESVGSIRIHYQFGGPQHLPAAGHETVPGPDPAKPCD
jgi:hypothetical protein